jgi:sulfonate transport system permease protein
MTNRTGVAVSGLLVPLAAIATWQVLESAGLLTYEYLPSPTEVLAAVVELTRTGELAGDLAYTLGVALVATAITLPLGGALGLAIGLVPGVRRYLLASIDFLRTIPAVALVPVAVLTFGPAPRTELMLAVYAGMWPIVLNTAGGVAGIHPRQYDVARTLQLSPAARLRKIVVPAVIPAWLVGARLSAVVALVVAIVTEMMVSPRGLGGGLVQSLNALAPARMWAYALVCGVVGMVLNAGLRRAVGLAVPTARPHSDVVASAQHIPGPRGLLPIAALLAVWQLTGSANSLSFPPPGQWLAALGRLHGDGLLFAAIGHTLGTYVFGLASAAVIGATAGVAIGASQRVDRALTPSIDFLAAVPGAALVPVVVLLLGPTQISGVAVVALVVSWPILMNAALAMRSIPAVRLEMSRTLGLSPVQRWGKVIAPSLAPGITLGVWVASSVALIVTLLVDIFGTGAGVGRLLVEAQQRFDASLAWGLLLMVGTFGYLTSVLLTWLGRRVAVPGASPARMRG